MSFQSDIDYLIEQHDRPDFYQNDIVADGGITAGMALLADMRNALEKLSNRMCPDCEGNGFVRNPHARYSEEYADGRATGVHSTNDPEEICCPRCDGVGFVLPKGIENLPGPYQG